MARAPHAHRTRTARTARVPTGGLLPCPQVVCILADHYFSMPRPWEPKVPEPAEGEGEDGTAEPAAPPPPSKDAAPAAEEEAAPAAEEAAEEAAAEEEADPLTRFVDGILLPQLAAHVASRLAELASAA